MATILIVDDVPLNIDLLVEALLIEFGLCERGRRTHQGEGQDRHQGHSEVFL